MIQKITLSLVASTTLMMGASSQELEARLTQLQKDFGTYKVAQDKKLSALQKEVSQKELKKQSPKADESTNEDDLFVSFSDLGMAASKVYNTDSALSIGGYGEYKYKKYTNFKNYSSNASNATRRKSETNVVRFVPYFGYKFNDWIVMNTEIEFEDGGARSDGTKNYKYAIVEFSYIDFMFDEKYNLRVGHVLVPFGNINLNHEPVSFLTTERPLVETFIIPSTWHTNGALVYGTIDSFDYYAGIITSPDAGKFTEGRFMQQGRLGAKQFTDDVSAVARVNYTALPGLEVGTSIYYGNSTTLAQSKPGVTSSSIDAEVSMFMQEAHVSYKANGWDVQALAVIGNMGGDYQNLTEHGTIAGSVNGQYLTVGYDFLHTYPIPEKLFAVAEIERLDLDADNETSNPDNYKFNEYTLGLAYFPDPKVVVKAEYSMKDYAEGSQQADEEAFTASVGFIF